jgi:topoisomerase IV subunit B
VFVAMPPLYRIDVGKDVYYALDDAERDMLLDRIEAEKKIRARSPSRASRGWARWIPCSSRDDDGARHPAARAAHDRSQGRRGPDLDMLLAKKRAADRRELAAGEGQSRRYEVEV